MVGGDQRDRLALVADHVDREHRLVLVLEAVVLGAGHVVVGEYGEDTRRLQRLTDVDAQDPGRRMRAAQRDAPQHVVHPEVAGVGEVAGDLERRRRAAAGSRRRHRVCALSCRVRLVGAQSRPSTAPRHAATPPLGLTSDSEAHAGRPPAAPRRRRPSRPAGRSAGPAPAAAPAAAANPSTSAATGSAMLAWAIGVEAPQRDVGQLAGLERADLVVPAEHPRAAEGGQLQAVADRERLGPPTARANSTEWRSSSTREAASLEAAPSTPSPTGTPPSRRSRVRQMPAPSRALDDGQCAMPVP